MCPKVSGTYSKRNRLKTAKRNRLNNRLFYQGHLLENEYFDKNDIRNGQFDTVRLFTRHKEYSFDDQLQRLRQSIGTITPRIPGEAVSLHGVFDWMEKTGRF